MPNQNLVFLRDLPYCAIELSAMMEMFIYMAIYSSTLAWKIPWTEEPDSPWGSKESDTTERINNNN